MLIRLVVGLGMTAIIALLAARRVLWLAKLTLSGQPVSGRTDDVGTRVWTQISEVFGQRRLLKWSIPGLAHFFTMWGFFILATVYVEAYGTLFQNNFHIPIVGRWDALGFLQDFIALSVVAGIATFSIIRLRSEPKEYGRSSRFYGSHTGGAWLILFMIFLVIFSFSIFRGASAANGTLPYGWGAFFSRGMGVLMHPLGTTANEWIETVALLAHIAVALVFLVIVLHSKHLHIFLAPINVTFKRLPDGLGPLLPLESDGKPIDFEDPAEAAVFGRGKIEDFTWKGMLDFATCTECGRCQSQCPAWNTGKPLSPKLVIMGLRDNMFSQASRLLAASSGDAESQPETLVPNTIEPDVLWSCVTCGACVEECPVDIEHVDAIVDMRRYEVLMESRFPPEAGLMLRNIENQGDPWGLGQAKRTEWTRGLDFEVPVVTDVIPDDIEYLYWVGCAGALDERARKGVQATARMPHRAA